MMRHLKKYKKFEGAFSDVPMHGYSFSIDDFIYDYCQEVAFIIGSKRKLEEVLGPPKIEHPRGYSSPITYWSIDFDDGLAVDIHTFNNSMQTPDDPHDLNSSSTIWYCSYNEYDWKWSDKIYSGRSEKEVIKRMHEILYDCKVIPEREYKDAQNAKLSDYIQAKQLADRANNEGMFDDFIDQDETGFTLDSSTTYSTGRIGTISPIRYASLKDVLGEPIAYDEDEYDKTRACWNIKFNDGIKCNIYDYKVHSTLDENESWSIGGLVDAHETRIFDKLKLLFPATKVQSNAEEMQDLINFMNNNR